MCFEINNRKLSIQEVFINEMEKNYIENTFFEFKSYFRDVYS